MTSNTAQHRQKHIQYLLLWKTIEIGSCLIMECNYFLRWQNCVGYILFSRVFSKFKELYVGLRNGGFTPPSPGRPGQRGQLTPPPPEIWRSGQKLHDTSALCLIECIYHLHLGPFPLNNQNDFKGFGENKRILLHDKTWLLTSRQSCSLSNKAWITDGVK